MSLFIDVERYIVHFIQNDLIPVNTPFDLKTLYQDISICFFDLYHS